MTIKRVFISVSPCFLLLGERIGVFGGVAGFLISQNYENQLAMNSFYGDSICSLVKGRGMTKPKGCVLQMGYKKF